MGRALGVFRIRRERGFEEGGEMATLSGFGLGLQDPRAAAGGADATTFGAALSGGTGLVASAAVVACVENVEAAAPAELAARSAGAKALDTGLLGVAGLIAGSAVLGVDFWIDAGAFAFDLSGGAGLFAKTSLAGFADLAAFAAATAVIEVGLEVGTGFTAKGSIRRAEAGTVVAALIAAAYPPATATVGGRGLERDAATVARVGSLGRARGLAGALGAEVSGGAGLAARAAVSGVA